MMIKGGGANLGPRLVHLCILYLCTYSWKADFDPIMYTYYIGWDNYPETCRQINGLLFSTDVYNLQSHLRPNFHMKTTKHNIVSCPNFAPPPLTKILFFDFDVYFCFWCILLILMYTFNFDVYFWFWCILLILMYTFDFDVHF